MEQPVEVLKAFGHEIKRYEDSMYGKRWICNCEDFRQRRSNQCWHITATIIDKRYWPADVAQKVAQFEAPKADVMPFKRGG